jgi:hypothetical protein
MRGSPKDGNLKLVLSQLTIISCISERRVIPLNLFIRYLPLDWRDNLGWFGDVRTMGGVNLIGVILSMLALACGVSSATAPVSDLDLYLLGRRLTYSSNHLHTILILTVFVVIRVS